MTDYRTIEFKDSIPNSICHPAESSHSQEFPSGERELNGAKS